MLPDPLQPHVTQKDVARQAGVSPSIVSYVINNGPRAVSPETRQRVLDAIERLAYRPNKHAQLLLRSRAPADKATREFGVIVGGTPSLFTKPFYGAILSGIYTEAQRLHMRIRFLQFLGDLRDPLLFNELIHPEEISGLLLFAVDGSLDLPGAMADALRIEVIERARARIANIVCVERKWLNLPAVVFDRVEAAFLAVNHLIRLGHRQIAFAGAQDDRLIGYRNALLAHGIPFDEHLILDDGSANTPEDGYRHAQALVGLGLRPTAVFACCDEVAAGLIGGLHEAGRRVPEDIALVSVDDIPLAAHLRPRLTTVHVPTAEMGGYAVRMLHDWVTHADQPPVSVVLPIHLAVRASCGVNLGDKTTAVDRPPSSPFVFQTSVRPSN
jgi:LacI family transcriptional regulator